MMGLTLHPFVLLLVVAMCRGEPDPEEQCPSGRSWSQDLGKCMDCTLCETSSKSDFCHKCEILDPWNFPWLIVGLSALGSMLIILILAVTVYLTHCRRKNKFTTPIEETGAHSAEELLIH
ncbi:tumor necrosis factor receptor superfamily member 12A [Pelobates cultripes]|uniref:Tumor necrosis factor receptor superfamily member 12A n=2 Tax=Pelobates cultripes TaxID=61616 RepID=A0AAD1WJI0_PELCU|nr:tumor necrosis factor receptor superfamily member 12A [Pelobates cultripes]